MKIAIVHDWLVTYGGAERVLERILEIYPEADIFTIVDFISSEHDFLKNRKIKTSFIQGFPFAKKKYRSYLPFMPLAIEQFDLGGYDLVISSSHAVSKGVLTGPDQLHICLCYSPARYAWDLQHQYLEEAALTSGVKSLTARWMLHKFRVWDYRTAAGVDDFVAISEYIARRIKKVYGRTSSVIYPPVDVDSFAIKEVSKEYYFTSSRMVPYKKVSLIIQAFSKMPDKKLIVIGDGPEFDRCNSLKSANVQLLGWQPFEVLRSHLQGARAFIFAAEEDFGIAPIEAQACGVPVVAFGKGAALETIRGLGSEKPTGVFFEKQTVESIVDALRQFEENESSISQISCRENAKRFSVDKFDTGFSEFVRNSVRKKFGN